MTLQVEGMTALRRRLRAIGDTREMLREMQLRSVREAKLAVPRKTGNLGRSIVPGALSDDEAVIRATAAYAAYVELGTKPHVIRPKRARALAFPATPADARLSGRVRRGGDVVFAQRVKHPGTKPQPFLLPAVKKAVREVALARGIIDRWNKAG